MASITSGKKFLEIAALNGVQTSLNLLTGLVSARALAPAGRGEFATVAVYATVLGTVLTLGIPQAVVAWKPSIRLVSHYVWGSLALAPLISCIAFAALISSGIVRSQGAQPLIAGTLLTSGGVYAGIATALHQRRQSFSWGFRLIRLGPGLLILGYMVTFWATSVDSPTIWLLTSGLALALPSLGICIVELRRSFTSEPTAAPRRSEHARKFSQVALGSAATILTAQIFFRLDSLVGASLLSLENVGYYVVALGAQAAIIAVASAATLVVHSDLARNRDNHYQKQIVRTSIRRSLLVTGPLALAAIITAPWIVPAVYGSDFSDSVHATQLLVLAAIPVAIDNVLLHAWLLMGRTRSLLCLQAAMCAIALGALSYAASTNNLVELALTALCVTAASCLAKALAVARLLNPKLQRKNDTQRLGGS